MSDEPVDESADESVESSDQTLTDFMLARRPWLIGGLTAIALVLMLIALVKSSNDGPPPPPPLPPGAVPIDVWAPYWTLTDSIAEADLRLGDIREVSPFWFGAYSATRISTDEHASDEQTDQFISLVSESNGRLVPSIRDEMPAGGMAAVLADPKSRTRHVEALMDFADDLDADGIDLDYEQFAFSDGAGTWATTSPNWVAFIEELATELHRSDRTLTVSIPPVYDVEATGDRGFWVYDHGAIAEFVDNIRIMAYDFSVPDPGPIAPLSWVRQAVDGTSLAVPEQFHHKLVLGVPAYGTNWVVSVTGDCPESAEGRTNVKVRAAADLAARRGGVPALNEVDGEWSFGYSLAVDDGTTSCVQERKVHWVDADGAALRVEIARRAGWGGVSMWALGYENDAVWSSIVSASRDPLAP